MMNKQKRACLAIFEFLKKELMKNYIFLILLSLPVLTFAQIPSNVKSAEPASEMKTMDLPKRKPVQEETAKPVVKPDDRPKRKPAPKTTEVSNTLKSILSEQTSDLINRATVVNAYEVESFVSENLSDDILEGFKILQMAILDNTQSANIKQLILSQDTYFFTEKNKQCLFLPKFGLQFVNGKDTANILISFKCDFTRFYQGSPITLNSDYGHEDLMELYQSVFPINISDNFTAQPVTLKSKNIPLLPPKPIYYTVQFGDSWVVVAQKATNTLSTSVSVDDLCEWNKINSVSVRKNQRFLMSGETIIVGFRK
jgi:hypothetical protein